MNWGKLLEWIISNGAAIVAAVMVIVRLVESAIAASKKTTVGVTKEFFTLG